MPEEFPALSTWTTQPTLKLQELPYHALCLQVPGLKPVPSTDSLGYLLGSVLARKVLRFLTKTTFYHAVSMKAGLGNQTYTNTVLPVLAASPGTS